ncbi:hypothetical protein N7492_003144 [Penicillium capsulatum]|uniref:Peptidase M10 metallopeptidase domain-containing protein n=1 Tax=Penicillium capsulatum TaxID=69766 RepID=A0A9W9LWP3_9EURO|nr:hypothetical protein N7492_003144 [Penicillium capsulatum]KAJ6122266.1 hypothetical protein N7512_004731 [Penicillium capsulatum]
MPKIGLILVLLVSLFFQALGFPSSNALTKRLDIQCSRTAYEFRIKQTYDPIRGYAQAGVSLMTMYNSDINGKGINGLPPGLRNIPEGAYKYFTEEAAKGVKKLFGLDKSSPNLGNTVVDIVAKYVGARKIEKSNVLVKCGTSWLQEEDDKGNPYSGEKPPEGEQAYWSTLHEDWAIMSPDNLCTGEDGSMGELFDFKKDPKQVMVICPKVFLEDQFNENEPQKILDSSSPSDLDTIMYSTSLVVFHEYLHRLGLDDSEADGHTVYDYTDLIKDFGSISPLKQVQTHLLFAVAAQFVLDGWNVNWDTENWKTHLPNNIGFKMAFLYHKPAPTPCCLVPSATAIEVPIIMKTTVALLVSK